MLLLPRSGGEAEADGESAGSAEATAEPEEAGDDDGPAEVVSSSITPAAPGVVEEHPANDAVTSTNPTVSSFSRVLIAFPYL